MYDDPKSKINQLEKILDAREDKVSKKIKRHELHNHESSIREDWNSTEPSKEDLVAKIREVGLEVKPKEGFTGGNMEIIPPVKKGIPLSMKVLIGSIIFFVLALLIVLYKFIGGGNIVSGDNILVTVKAPVSIAGGETVPIEIEVRNNNSVALSGTDLGINFPSGTVKADDVSVPLVRNQEFLGNIPSGQSAKRNFKVILFGSENEKKIIKLNLEYKVAGSNSIFSKTKEFSVLITSSPVSLSVHAPNEVNTNQAINFSVDVSSNSNSVIKNLLLKVDYPFGFSFGDSNPAVFAKNNTWLIGDLAPGEKRTINISGMITGQEGEERGFNFSLGTQSTSDNTVLQTPFITSFSALTIRRPFVSADIFFNGSNADEYIAGAGDKVESVIKWQNNLPYRVTNVSLNVKLNGNALDKSSVVVDGGFYRSYDNTIVFDKTTDNIFASLEPGQSGENKFELKSFGINSISGSNLSNPSIYLDISVSGKTVDANGKIQDVTFADARRIKVTSEPRVFAKSLYYVGPFQNRGPVPPKAESETTYTVTWTVTNPLNSLSGTRVTTILPPYVKWLGAVSPALEKMSYDENTRQITWSLGNVTAGAGSISPAKEVSFQLSILPSVSQIGSTPNLTNEVILSAKDSFTNTSVNASFQAVGTTLINDPYFRLETDKVVK